MNEFRTRYKDPNITKWDIFHYVYAVLHHPEYRERYAANLKRELPRIPYVGMIDRRDKAASLQSQGSPTSAKTAQIWGTNADRVATDQKQVDEGVRPDPSVAETEVRRQEERPYARLTDEEKHSVLSNIKRMQELGILQYKSQDNARVFRVFADAGKRLADLHVNYEQQPEYPLEKIENPNEKINWRVEKMRLGKDKSSLFYNTFLTLSGIPLEAYEYRLGNRSALEWVIDQYQVSTDKRSGITNDPNREDDPEYIVRLIGQVVQVSVETVKIVKALPELGPLVDDSETK